MERSRRKTIFKKFSKYNFFILALAFCFIFLNFNNHFAQAQLSVSVSDQGVKLNIDSLKQIQSQFNEYMKQKKEEEPVKRKSLSSILANVLGAALKKIAFDSATWLGSGGHGQKPMFITEGWGPYITNIGDQAVGQFIETLGKENGFAKFNLCKPDINVVVKIGLGLVQEVRPGAPACTFSEMTKNWSKVLQDKNFLNKFQNMFDPTSNDLGISLTLHQNLIEEKNRQQEAAKNTRETNKGWINVQDVIAGKDTAVPGYSEMIAQMTLGLPQLLLPKDYGDAIVNAENVFLNQFFLTLVKTQLAKLGGADTTSPYTGNYGGFANKEASPGNSGQAGMEGRLAKIIQPNFTVSGDFNILSQLANCPDPTKAGPTDCVIDEKFSQAIQDKKTVAQAISEGYLNGSAPFGFASISSDAGPIEPFYNSGYPYRSMMILRKYRILPVGWEMAAQAISIGVASSSMPVKLSYLVACFNNSSYPDWCRGLVDPDWVLKAPQNYCKKQGYGPLLSAQNDNDVYKVVRNKYCADEQSCIKEKTDGSCDYYGYCTEDRRIWKFGSNDCDPHYNTCQSFKSAAGQSVSYLNDTLDYGNCSASNSGCSGYCLDYSPSAASLALNISQSSAAMNVNVPINTDFNGSAAAFTGLTNVLPPNGNFNNSVYTNTYLGNGNSNIIFYYNNTDNRIYLVFVHGGSISPSGSANFNLNITNTAGDSAELVLMNNDATGIATYQGSSPTSLPLPIVDNSSFSLAWTWGPAISAGGVIKMPEGNWTLTITPGPWTGINNWQILYEKAGVVTPIQVTNRTQPLTISKASGNGNWLCSSNTGNKRYFNGSVETCDADAEGCHKLIRTDPSAGSANYVINGGFEENTVGQALTADSIAGPGYYTLGNWTVNTDSAATTITVADNSISGAQIHSGNNSIRVVYTPPAAPTSLDKNVFYLVAPNNGQSGAVLPVDFKVKKDTLYTFSAWVYTVSGSGVELSAGDGGTNWYTASSTATGGWERVALNFVNRSMDGFDVDKFLISQANPTAVNEFYLDDIQLEKGDITVYSDYGSRGVVYEKLIPDYFMKACYQPISDYYTRIPGSTSECDSFVRYCTATEAGCKMYTSKTTSMSVPAQAGINNNCPATCVGYDKYLQTETSFESTKIDRIIPKMARKCSAAAAGCDEFTNLDKLSQGGEAKEYYSYLRQCRKPDDQCATFYTWEGSNESGYQLHTYQLQQDGSNSPFVYDYLQNGIPCDASTYNLLVNPDCRAFYNDAGQISYQYYNYTVICSNNCHPYRKTENNVVVDPTTEQNLSQSDCEALSQFQTPGPDQYQDINYNGGICTFCKGNGVWDSETQACVYMTIPSESKKCGASSVGCREFNGNQGANTQIILNDNFEDGTINGWQSDNGAIDSTQNPSNDSLMLGGHSLYVSAVATNDSTIYKNVGYAVQKGAAYVLSFLTNGPVNMAASLTDNAGNSTPFSTLQINTGMSGEWAYYQINIPELTHDVTSNERLVITNGTAFNIDNIKLTKIIDRYYLIKWNLSDIPPACLYDTLGNYVGYDVNLGCDAYTDSNNSRYYLNGFNRLCQQSSVGCEEMIDTHNSISPASSSVAISTGEVAVPPDNIIYAIYDQDKLCDVGDKGCTRLGAETKYANNAIYRTKYLKDDPDKHSSILCSSQEDGCNTWTTNDGTAYYFKDPGNNTCQWRQGQMTNPWGWYETQAKRCDRNTDNKITGNETVCLTSQDCADTTANCASNSDCGQGATCTAGTCYYACLPDTTDHPCPDDRGSPKTIGLDSTGNLVYQPRPDVNNINWVGLCPAAESSCTEYLDPVSRNGQNLIAATSWASTSPTQSVFVENNTLYRFASGAHTNDYTIDCDSPVLYYLGSDNVLHSSASLTLPASSITATNPTGENSLIFNSGLAYNNTCLITASGHDSSIELRQIGVDYQLRDDLDKKTCNGMVNYNNGCVLFNERTQLGSNLASLNYDANLTINNPTGINNRAAPVAGSPADNNNANQLIKVTPDRVCDKWLSCNQPYYDRATKKQVCLSVQDCTKMKTDGTCTAHADHSGNIIHNFDYNLDQNATGYVSIGNYYIGDMSQPGSQVIIPNGDFEKYNSVGAPLNWTIVDGADWNEDKSYVVHKPSEAIKYNINYPANGYALLRLAEKEQVRSVSIAVKPDTDYYLTYLVFTTYLKSINSDASARLTIYGSGLRFNNAPPAVDTVYDDTPQGKIGWQRKVIYFNSGNATYVSITLGAYSPTVDGLMTGGAMFFDDLEINPNLEVKPIPEPTIPRTCRLYPEASSISCDYYDLLKGVGRGYYGYCLLYDEAPGDSDNCLMWYPVDQVNSQYQSAGGNGYTGKAPVYYCTDMNARFNFLEKRVDTLVYYKEQCDWDFGSILVFLVAGGGGLLSQIIDTSIYDILTGTGGGDSTSCEAKVGNAFCGSDNYCVHVVVNEGDCDPTGLFKKEIKSYIYCEPKINDGDVRHIPIVWLGGRNGWFLYDGQLAYHQREGSNTHDVDESKPEVFGSDPVQIFGNPVQIFDYSRPLVNGPSRTEDDLIDPANYHLTCNEFFQTVQNDGTNMAWSGRVMTGSSYLVELPAGSTTTSESYTIGSEDAPFGSAIIPVKPDNSKEPLDPRLWDGDSVAGLQPIKFRDTSNTNSGSVIAGLPYGCTDRDTIENRTCAAIGRCSTSRQYLCALPYQGPDRGPTGTNRWTPDSNQFALGCPSSESCVPITGLNSFDAEGTASTTRLANVGQIFATSYARIIYQDGQYEEALDPQITPPGNVCPPYGDYNNIEQDRPFCYYPPRIENVEVLDPNGTNVNGGSNTFTPLVGGIYTFRFNIIVDSDQMPLVDVNIQWGIVNGSGQPINTDWRGQFNDYSKEKFSASREYLQSSDPITFRISATDNWKKTSSF